MQHGSVKKFIDGKGYGFIQPDDGSNDIFVHINNVENADYLQQGRRVSFEVVPDRRSGRPQARNVHIIG
jgi:CspA family cold shock protein